jgi:xylan 1,4-beta-xylosidase
MPTPSTATSLFSTAHAPVGAWASFHFGGPAQGARIQQNGLPTEQNADLLVGVQRGSVTTILPFVEAPEAYAGWRVAEAADISRSLTPCVEEFASAATGMTFRVFTPHAALPNPKRSGNLQYATAPGVLMELIIDNSQSDSPATAFVALNAKGSSRLRPADWSSKTLSGVGHAGDWLLAATTVKGEVFTVQSRSFAERLASGVPVVEAESSLGGVVIQVPARATKSVNLVLAFFDAGNATQGIHGRYLYTAYFQRIEAVANFLLLNAQKIRESCENLDKRLTEACEDSAKLSVFSRAVRTYEGRTQLTDAEGVPYFTVLDEAGHRNTLDSAVDQLPWELFRNPWVIRNVLDLYTGSYSYRDQLRGEAAPSQEGGLIFARDCGLGSCYSPNGISSSERTGMRGGGAFMSTESLLNGVYLLTSYALVANDTPWSKTRLPFARDLLTSMENRDNTDPVKRTGILKAEAAQAGDGAEVTAYVGCGAALERVPGNLILAVKTFCASLMLTTYFQGNNDLHSADYSYAFAQKTAVSLVAALDQGTGILPANLLDGGATGESVIAALEPLAVPTYLGLTSTLAEYFPELFEALKRHALSCLKGGCIDAATGSLRLTSASGVVIPSKVVSVLYVLERLFGIDVQAEYPGVWNGVATAGDAITAALFLKTPTEAA